MLNLSKHGNYYYYFLYRIIYRQYDSFPLFYFLWTKWNAFEVVQVITLLSREWKSSYAVTLNENSFSFLLLFLWNLMVLVYIAIVNFFFISFTWTSLETILGGQEITKETEVSTLFEPGRISTKYIPTSFFFLFFLVFVFTWMYL